MKTKELALTALFLAMGLVLHQITIGLVAGMKPDLSLPCCLLLFCCCAIDVWCYRPASSRNYYRPDHQHARRAGALIIDKLITAFLPWGSFGCYKGMWLIMSGSYGGFCRYSSQWYCFLGQHSADYGVTGAISSVVYGGGSSHSGYEYCVHTSHLWYLLNSSRLL